MSYDVFIEGKKQMGGEFGFAPTFMPEFLFPFQQSLVEWSLRKGRAAVFADCGLGKTPMQLVWAQNVVEKTNKPVLVLTPLSVGSQTVSEGEKFGITCAQSRDGSVSGKITVTNYQQLHKFDWKEFGGVVCDESSILKNFDGAIKAQITDFMRKLPYRLLCTATAAPNDYIELGTSSEALGHLGFTDMVSRFFKKSEQTMSRSEEFRAGLYRFRGHAERDASRRTSVSRTKATSSRNYGRSSTSSRHVLETPTSFSTCRPSGFQSNAQSAGAPFKTDAKWPHSSSMEPGIRPLRGVT